jgi:hypothetical protein
MLNILKRFIHNRIFHGDNSENFTRQIEKYFHSKINFLKSNKKLHLSEDQIVRIDNAFSAYCVAFKDNLRIYSASNINYPPIYSHSGVELGVHIMEKNPPWDAELLEDFDMPGMITREEAKYYKWISEFYSGKGRVVELGPWLGASTRSIIAGLRSNQAFAGQKLLVFDDFVWRKSWMDPYVEEKDRLANHQSFRHLFDRYTAPVAPDLTVQRARFAAYDGNESVPPLQWNSGAIELMFVDCGRTIAANEGWYSALSPYFIPDKTIVVLQDWRVHREVPFRWYNQTELFTLSKKQELQMIHELNDGGAATFLYVGGRQ